jgi:DNA-binding response OmpR family regulator
MDTSVRSARAYRFGLFEVDLNNAQLSRKGVRLRLQEQPFHILSLLLRRPGQVVTREDFRPRRHSATLCTVLDLISLSRS